MSEELQSAQAAVIALERALARGVLMVSFGSRMETFDNTQGLLNRLSYFRSRVAALSGRNRQTVVYATKGY